MVKASGRRIEGDAKDGTMRRTQRGVRAVHRKRRKKQACHGVVAATIKQREERRR